MKRHRPLIILAVLALAILIGEYAPVRRDVQPVPVVTIQTAPEWYQTMIPLFTVDYIEAVSTPKKGLALATTCGDPKTGQAKRLGAGWLYNWRVDPPVIAGVESVPMVWGATFLNATLGGNSLWVAGPNEPNNHDESNLTPEQGAVLWRQLEGLYPDRLLVSPAPTMDGAVWLEQFRDAYKAIYQEPPRLDALAIHCYYPTADRCIAVLQDVIEYARAWGVREVWLTEFAMLGAAPGAMEMEAWKLVTWMEYNPMIGRYAMFTNSVECLRSHYGSVYDGIALFDDQGDITPLGQAAALLPELSGIQAIPYP